MQVRPWKTGDITDVGSSMLFGGLVCQIAFINDIIRVGSLGSNGTYWKVDSFHIREMYLHLEGL
jgi:hypothetical protein